MILQGLEILKNLLTEKGEDSKKYRSEKSVELIKTTLADQTQYWYNFTFKEFEIGREILKLDLYEQSRIALDLIDWLTDYENDLKEKRKDKNFNGYNQNGWKVRSALIELFRKHLPFSRDELLEIIDWSMIYDSNYWRVIPQVIKQLQAYLKGYQLSQILEEKIRKYIEVISAERNQNEQTRKQIVKLKEIIGEVLKNPLIEGEAWSDLAISDVDLSNTNSKTTWIEILTLCQNSSGSAPNAKWKKSVEHFLEKIGFDEFKSYVLRWFPLVDKPRTAQVASWSEWQPNPNLMLNDANADILKGLVWGCGLREDKEIARALMNLAISAYKKVPMIGPRCVRVGNACVWALGQMGLEGVGQLAILKLKVKFGTAQKGIEKALNETAKKIGLPAEELEEMSVPDYGLAEVGLWRTSFGDFAAELIVMGTNSAEIRWFNADAKQQKSVPAFVKENHAEELKELNNNVKDIKKMLPAQRDRIENLYLEEKRWDYKIWRERYLDHRLVGTIARRLIWRFNDATTAIFLDGKLVDKDGNALELFDDSQVELWHPLHSSTAEVLEWREFLEKHEIRQPFKQAHREIYVLTDAERNTQVYSNRYAAHIIKQHQFNALCGQRNWKNQLRIMADADFHAPMRTLSKSNLRAEFWVEAIGDDYGVDSNETGTYLYLATDQVRFYPIDAPLHYGHGYGGGYHNGWNQTRNVEPLPLDRIPPLIFSEIMRDVDMFVGVCSIGNDPNWADNGRERHNEYWREFSFGDLSATAKTRKELLERMIPRLKIAPRCSFEDKFLLVKGDLRDYKIHLGSGNILMSPNDQYLCIVPSGSAETFGQGKVFLPFEGDRVLSIILSKAFMLAEDTRITDQTITRQIKR
ncbi:MAG TPA: DUF4132 domain-containing protein [Pyrinomonadaceae bacterium]|nr:DUF4132 domain-containing protein [Pyrinomonadaceae bacterium]